MPIQELKCIRKATFICVFLNSLIICLTSLPRYVKWPILSCVAFGLCVIFVLVVLAVVFQLYLRCIRFSYVSFTAKVLAAVGDGCTADR
jgi:hypothetical protein